MNLDSDFIMSAVIALIMFGIGFGLKFKDFFKVFIHPKAVIIGLAGQLILMPIAAFILVIFWDLDPVYKVGIIVIASAPGGTASNLVTHMLKGRVALSVSMTSLNSFAILLTIPFFIGQALSMFMSEQTEINITFTDTFNKVFLVVVAPVFTGVIVNEVSSDAFSRILNRPLRYILPALLLVVFGIAVFSGKDGKNGSLFENLHVFYPLLVLNLGTMLLGFFLARLMRTSHPAQYTIAVEMGLQNTALAIFIASQILQSPEAEQVAVMYSSFSFVSTWLIAWLMKHYLIPLSDKKKQNEKPQG